MKRIRKILRAYRSFATFETGAGVRLRPCRRRTSAPARPSLRAISMPGSCIPRILPSSDPVAKAGQVDRVLAEAGLDLTRYWNRPAKV